MPPKTLDKDDSPASIQKRKGRELSDPLAHAGRTARDETARMLSLVSKGVRYTDFMDADPPIEGVNVFEELRTVALVDKFFQLDDAEVCKRLRMKPENLEHYRQHPLYPQMVEALKASARRIGGVSTIDGLAETMEREVAHELLGIGLLEMNVREKRSVLGDLADRRSAKKGRQGDGPQVLVMPDRWLELIQLAAGMEPRLLKQVPQHPGLPPGPTIDIPAEDDDISADRLNVPVQEEDG